MARAGDPPGEDDDRAEAIVFAENDERSDLSAWELALAWRARRDRRRARDLPAAVRDLAAAYGKKHQTVAPYLAAAEAITPEVLAAAALDGVDGEPEHERLARLPLAALQRVTRAAAAGTTAAAERLLRELSKCGDGEASTLLVSRARAAWRTRSGGGRGVPGQHPAAARRDAAPPGGGVSRAADPRGGRALRAGGNAG